MADTGGSQKETEDTAAQWKPLSVSLKITKLISLFKYSIKECRDWLSFGAGDIAKT